MAASDVKKGVTGNIVIDVGTTTAGGRLYRWEMNYHQDANDSSGFGTNWRRCEFGLQNIQGRGVGYLTGVAPGVGSQQQKAFITLTADTSCTYSGTAIISNIRAISDLNTNDAVSFDFASDGAWLESAAWT